jgi:hypothetical protein
VRRERSSLIESRLNSGDKLAGVGDSLG